MMTITDKNFMSYRHRIVPVLLMIQHVKHEPAKTGKREKEKRRNKNGRHFRKHDLQKVM